MKRKNGKGLKLLSSYSSQRMTTMTTAQQNLNNIQNGHLANVLTSVNSYNKSQNFQHLKELFPSIEDMIISDVLVQCQNDFHTAIDYLISFTGGVNTDKETNETEQTHHNDQKVNYFSELSYDCLWLIAEFLNPFEQAKLSYVCKTFKSLIHDIFLLVDRLLLTKYRHWSDEKLLSMVRCFGSAQSISFKRCHQFQSFKRLRDVCFGHVPILSLNLAQCYHLTDEDVQSLMQLNDGEGVPNLDFSSTSISDDAIETIVAHQQSVEANSNTQRLILNECKNITSHAISRIFTYCNQLSVLELKGTHTIPSTLSNLSSNAQLIKLNLSDCLTLSSTVDFSALTNRGLSQLTDLSLASNLALRQLNLSLPQLRLLNVSNCKYCHSISLSTPLLQSLNMSGCQSLSQFDVGDSLSQLSTINLVNCRSIQSAAFELLVAAMQSSLENFQATGLSITDSNIRLLADLCTRLHQVELNGCKFVQPQTLQYLMTTVEQRKRQRNNNISDTLTSMKQITL